MAHRRDAARRPSLAAHGCVGCGACCRRRDPLGLVRVQHHRPRAHGCADLLHHRRGALHGHRIAVRALPGHASRAHHVVARAGRLSRTRAGRACTEQGVRPGARTRRGASRDRQRHARFHLP
ncbi:hypothetical protein ACFPRL_17330 [Pseudoclavibacter helvolus]